MQDLMAFAFFFFLILYFDLDCEMFKETIIKDFVINWLESKKEWWGSQSFQTSLARINIKA